MRAILDPFSFVVISIAGWMNQHQQHVIEYLIEENRVLREQIGNRRLRFSDNQRDWIVRSGFCSNQKRLPVCRPCNTPFGQVAVPSFTKP